MTALHLRGDRLDVVIDVPSDEPAGIASVRLGPDGGSLIAPHPLVVVFSSTERQPGRMNQTYAGSAIGARLRHAGDRSWSDDRGTHLEIVQRDAGTGLVVVTTLSAPVGAAALRFRQEARNEGDTELVLVALASASLGVRPARLADLLLTSGESGWTSEGRWRERPWSDLLAPVDLGRNGQDAAGRFGRTSHGTWSTGEFHPVGVLTDPASGLAMAWEVESSGPWHWEVGPTPSGGYLSVLGPADAEHQLEVRLSPGAGLIAPPATVAFSEDGRDGAIGSLTDARRAARRLRAVDAGLPVVYNDFLNTLLGDPSTARLEPLIRTAADVGAEYFCIDAGWFAAPGTSDWWSSVGLWREAPERFSAGLTQVLDLIRSRGMTPGMWLEPEVIGVDSDIAMDLPEDAFLRRGAERLVVHGRYHLDFSHPSAREHADAALAYLVDELGVGFVKLDYNVNPVAASPLDLLRHVTAHRDWLERAQIRYPQVLFENCGAGAMRADAGILALAHLQSTSDQPDAFAYAPIAAAAPMGILPELSGNWAVPAVGESLEQTAFSLVNGLAGRLYLSGFLDQLVPAQLDLVRDAIATAKTWRTRVASSHPLWPLGLPSWDSPHVALALDCGDHYLVALWSRGTGGRLRLPLPGVSGTPQQVFPARLEVWSATTEHGVVLVDVPAGPAARVLAVKKP